MDPNAAAAYASSFNYGESAYAAPSGRGDFSSDSVSQGGWTQWPKHGQGFPNQSFQYQQQVKPPIGNLPPVQFNTLAKSRVGFPYGIGASPAEMVGTLERSVPNFSHEWVRQNQMRSFPHRKPPQSAQWKNRPKTSQQKAFDATGKTPAMVLHELFKTVAEEYTEVCSNPKRYCCTLSVSGQEFKMESSNKKTSKQKCAELVLRTLRPDLKITPFEEPIAAKPAPSSKRNATTMECQPPIVPKPIGSTKKAKLSAAESAVNLNDFLRKLILETGSKLTPIFEVSENTVKIEEDNEMAEKKRNFKSEAIVTLRFEENERVFTKTGTNRALIKELVCKEALSVIFDVGLDDIRMVLRRAAINKIGKEFAIVPALNTVCSLMNCTLSLSVEASEDTPLGVGKMFYVGKCRVIDHNENDKPVEYVSPSLASKQVARDYAAQEMLKNYFGIDANNCPQSENVNSQGPCATLHLLLSKDSKNKSKIAYEFKENVPTVAGQSTNVFYCDCVIDDKERFTGSGRSKKLAKNAAAIVAIKKIFSIDFDPNVAYPLAMSRRFIAESRVSPLCRDVTEFVKREYLAMCGYYGISPSNLIACFLLLNEKDEKRLISIGSSTQYVVEPDTLSGANGTTLIHLDPIVLARRSMLRYLMQELKAFEVDHASSIFDRHIDGKAILKANLRLVLFSNFPPVCSLSVDDAAKKRLGYVTPLTIAPAPDEALSFDEIKSTKTLRVHCTADKLFKWSAIGVQGALLSNLMHPIIANTVFFGCEAPVPDESLKYALFGRLGAPKNEIVVESYPTQMRFLPTSCHLQTRGIDGVERIDYVTGRTVKGSPSRVSKAEMFEAYRALPGVDLTISKYADAKKSAAPYQAAKMALYESLAANGWGRWQTKPENLTDDFVVASFD
ncbi:unnamed protein product [Caenorhabditis bovis]|uniref:Uncharacterized protein n=1 Tax=Caenorhabditis bovis TaxID=2654633 RepID=A0A8S1F1J9_9PELO|nr:unnamed protein product [Caenorhabditis bovis]